MPRKKISDEHLLLDFFIASKPIGNQHRLSFTIKFSELESDRLRKMGAKYISGAYQTVRNLLKNSSGEIPFLHMALVVEEGKLRSADMSACSSNSKTQNEELSLEDAIAQARKSKPLHVHGWVTADKTFTCQDFVDQVKSKKLKGRKLSPLRTVVVRNYNIGWRYDYEDEYLYEDEYIHIDSGQTAFTFDVDAHPVDSGWVAYIVKFISESPKGCMKPKRMFAACDNTRAKALALRKRRSKKFEKLTRHYFDISKDDWKERQRKKKDQGLTILPLPLPKTRKR